MRTTTFTLLFLVIFMMTTTLCAGRIGGQSERCLCGGKLQKRVKFQNVKEINSFSPSALCPRTELLITLKTGNKTCLDPDGKQGKKILKGKLGKKGKMSKRQGGRKQAKNQP
ncbi:C-X-C motif chemokine 9-like [Hoplias malabaricus]|uniref:C-X-C motif chemokine 9-like n=1 Tax=Hoplias malabaricus TaxID=27720 RepID=UPI0034629621